MVFNMMLQAIAVAPHDRSPTIDDHLSIDGPGSYSKQRRPRFDNDHEDIEDIQLHPTIAEVCLF